MVKIKFKSNRLLDRAPLQSNVRTELDNMFCIVKVFTEAPDTVADGDNSFMVN